MEEEKNSSERSCRTEVVSYTQYRNRLHEIVDNILKGCDDDKCYAHIDYEQLPLRTAVIEILDKLRSGVLDSV